MGIYAYRLEAVITPEDPECESDEYEGIVYAESYPDAMARLVQYYGECIITVDELTATEFEDIIEFRDVKEYLNGTV